MKKVVCILLLICMTGTVFARDFEAELAAAKQGDPGKWATYVIGMGIALIGIVLALALNDPESDDTTPLVVGGTISLAGILLAFYGIPTDIDSREVERLEYVVAHPNIPYFDKEAIADGKIYLGMKEEYLLASWGEPHDINKSVGSWGVHKQYVYGSYSYGTPKYVYVENGVITSWQN